MTKVDLEVVERASAGDMSAFRQIVAAYDRTVMSLLVGPKLPIGRTRLTILGGLSRVFSDGSVDGVTIDAVPVSLRRTAFPFGLDVLSPAGRRIDYVGGLRVTPGVERSERSRELGVGRTIVRLTFGVRVALVGR